MAGAGRRGPARRWRRSTRPAAGRAPAKRVVQLPATTSTGMSSAPSRSHSGSWLPVPARRRLEARPVGGVAQPALERRPPRAEGWRRGAGRSHQRDERLGTPRPRPAPARRRRRPAGACARRRSSMPAVALDQHQPLDQLGVGEGQVQAQPAAHGVARRRPPAPPAAASSSAAVPQAGASPPTSRRGRGRRRAMKAWQRGRRSTTGPHEPPGLGEAVDEHDRWLPWPTRSVDSSADATAPCWHDRRARTSRPPLRPRWSTSGSGPGSPTPWSPRVALHAADPGPGRRRPHQRPRGARRASAGFVALGLGLATGRPARGGHHQRDGGGRAAPGGGGGPPGRRAAASPSPPTGPPSCTASGAPQTVEQDGLFGRRSAGRHTPGVADPAAAGVLAVAGGAVGRRGVGGPRRARSGAPQPGLPGAAGRVGPRRCRRDARAVTPWHRLAAAAARAPTPEVGPSPGGGPDGA